MNRVPTHTHERASACVPKAQLLLTGYWTACLQPAACCVVISSFRRGLDATLYGSGHRLRAHAHLRALSCRTSRHCFSNSPTSSTPCCCSRFSSFSFVIRPACSQLSANGKLQEDVGSVHTICIKNMALSRLALQSACVVNNYTTR